MPLQLTPKALSRGLGPSMDSVPQLSPVLQIQSDLRLLKFLVPGLSSWNSLVVAVPVGACGDVRFPAPISMVLTAHTR